MKQLFPIIGELPLQGYMNAIIILLRCSKDGNLHGKKNRFMAALSQRQLFFQHVAQTSGSPPALQIARAEGCFQWDVDGKQYLDLISGISVANVGHCHPDVVHAIQEQAARYMHVMVYGEFIVGPQVDYASLLTSQLPVNLDVVYFTNSGAEATEGAMKLAKRYTGRSRIIAFKKSYHGSTQGALSLIGDEYWRNAYRPLLPDIHHFDYGCFSVLDAIDKHTACVVVEPVQAESGITVPPVGWLKAVSDRCSETGALFIADEIQTGFGRTGSLWSFESAGVIPDILLLGKALGGGLPLGAFVANKSLMQSLSTQPVLGHITTFGGHPVSCAAGLAAFKLLLSEGWIRDIPKKASIIQDILRHPAITQVRTAGLWAAVHLNKPQMAMTALPLCYKEGIITDWFLFEDAALRLAPPLCITETQLRDGCIRMLKALDAID
jgi:acetylornithine/succinyldiaminopimelate/putrescine aminotransferase